MTYLGRSSMIRDQNMVTEERFPMSEQGYTMGKLLDGTECHILLETGVSKSFMSKSHYLCCKPLTHYLNLHLKHREFKEAVNNMLVYFSTFP